METRPSAARHRVLHRDDGNAVRAIGSEVSRYFDRSKLITLTGRVNAVVMQFTEPTFLVLDVDAGQGKTEQWGVHGRAATDLGWTPRAAPVKLGETVTVTAYRVRAGSSVEAILPADHGRLAETANAGRIAHGTEVKLADGRTLAFGER